MGSLFINQILIHKVVLNIIISNKNEVCYVFEWVSEITGSSYLSKLKYKFANHINVRDNVHLEIRI